MYIFWRATCVCVRVMFVFNSVHILNWFDLFCAWSIHIFHIVSSFISVYANAQLWLDVKNECHRTRLNIFDAILCPLTIIFIAARIRMGILLHFFLHDILTSKLVHLFDARKILHRMSGDNLFIRLIYENYS